MFLIKLISILFKRKKVVDVNIIYISVKNSLTN